MRGSFFFNILTKYRSGLFFTFYAKKSLEISKLIKNKMLYSLI